MKSIIISLKLLVILTVLLGIAYPLLITGFAQVFFKDKANGSFISKNEIIIGSSLIGQSFEDSTYFSSRPSMVEYNPLPSGASNQGLSNIELYQTVMKRKERFFADNQLSMKDTIPSEMIFASGSGLDPHISPQAAKLQINRIVRNRNFSEIQKQNLVDLIDKMTEQPQFGIFGKRRINVLLLNMRLDEVK